MVIGLSFGSLVYGAIKTHKSMLCCILFIYVNAPDIRGSRDNLKNMTI